MNPILLIILILIALLVLTAFVCFALVMQLWTQAFFSGVPLSPLLVARWAFRRNPPPKDLIIALVRLKHAGFQVPPRAIEAHALQGGDCNEVVNALIAAQLAGAPITFEQACEQDLAGRAAR